MNLPTQSGMDITEVKGPFHPTSTLFAKQGIDEGYSTRDNPGAINLDIERFRNCTQSFSRHASPNCRQNRQKCQEWARSDTNWVCWLNSNLRFGIMRECIKPLISLFLLLPIPQSIPTIRSTMRTVDRTGFVPTKTTGKRLICTVHGTKHLFEGMKDRPNPFLSFSLGSFILEMS